MSPVVDWILNRDKRLGVTINNLTIGQTDGQKNTHTQHVDPNEKVL